MEQEQLLKQIIEEVMKSMNGNKEIDKSHTVSNTDRMDVTNYPLGEKVPERIKTPTGKLLSEITLDKVISGEIGSSDVRISPETLEMQAQVSESVNKDAFANNLRRASELIAVPDDRLLEIYNLLRPYRSTKEELYDIARELEEKYNCTVNANFVREAADVYEARGRLRKDI
ncbi:MAG: diol dehydratase small subunit [Tissierella sp.]|nr:diol dehydratase small subunit [Tissierella sp.]